MEKYVGYCNQRLPILQNKPKLTLADFLPNSALLGVKRAG